MKGKWLPTLNEIKILEKKCAHLSGTALFRKMIPRCTNLWKM